MNEEEAGLENRIRITVMLFSVFISGVNFLSALGKGWIKRTVISALLAIISA